MSKRIDQAIWPSVQQDIDNLVEIKDILIKYEISYKSILRAKNKGLLRLSHRRSQLELEQIRNTVHSITDNEFKEVYKLCGYSVNAWLKHFKLSYTVKNVECVKLCLNTHNVESYQISNLCYSINDLEAAVVDSTTFTNVCRILDVSVCSYNFDRIRDLCYGANIDVSHLVAKNGGQSSIKWTEDTIFVENCTISRCNLRPVLKRLGFYTGVCAECGITDFWNGKPLTIEIDHVNGDHTDNRKENLRWLCPNCHSQTDTYRRRNKGPLS